MRLLLLILVAGGACSCGGGADTATAGGGERGTDDAVSSGGAETRGRDAGPTTGPRGDGSTGAVEGSCEGTLASVQDAIFAASCNAMGCHDSVSAAAGLDLQSDGVAGRLVGVAASTCEGHVLVAPGDPATSFLMAKLSAAPGCGMPMPLAAPLLPATRQACLASWIEATTLDCETCGAKACIDLQNGSVHCGACDVACPDGIGCQSGSCACPAGTSFCDGDCVDISSDPRHCGSCDAPCNEGLVCLAGGCGADCAGLSDCEGACVALDSNLLHCGGCDLPCAAGETCAAGSCGCEGEALSYAADIESLFVEHCSSMGCHSGGPMPPQAGLRLAEGQGYAELVGVDAEQCGNRRLVEPGSPSSSYLLDKLLGVNLCSGTKMPKMGAGFSAAELESVSRWICGGALP